MRGSFSNVQSSQSQLEQAREEFHRDLIQRRLLVLANGIPTNADKKQATSVALAKHIAGQIGGVPGGKRLASQSAGDQFEYSCKAFIERSFALLAAHRPGDWEVLRVPNRKGIEYIARFAQYSHLRTLDKEVLKNPELRSALGNAYDISPDIVISRSPLADHDLNVRAQLVDDRVGLRSELRSHNQKMNLLHAVVSCKWTFRSDRAQNARAEALNLLRNRKGRAPHIVVVTAEPSPNRLASLALGTGDIDCLYHFALPELQAAVADVADRKAGDLLANMVNGNRLKDIADLPLDLAA